MSTPAATNTIVRVFTRILDCGQECARLWHFLRAISKNGSGRVLFNRLWLAQQMGVSVRTIQRWIKQGLERGWFRRVEKLSGNVTAIYLSGIKALFKNLGIDSLGAIADVPSTYLVRSEAKALCTALEAQYRQRQAYWAAKRAAKGRRKQLVLNPGKMASSETVAGARGHLVVSAPFSIPGCSHTGLAKATDWSQSTIKRRLDNRWRCDRNLDTIQKVRVGVEVDDSALLFELRESNQSFLVTENALGHRRVLKVLNDAGRSKVVSLGCNIYSTGYELLSCRSLRRRVKPQKDASQLCSPLV
ncbi:MAG: hypothetical protein AAFV85_23185 [Cyanobacteria bacterium J06634_6]